jgi:hypothetical protein
MSDRGDGSDAPANGRSVGTEVTKGDMADDPPSVQQHLRGASDAILLLVGEVEQLERHKRGVEPGDARFDELASAVRVAAQALSDFTREEEAWAREADARGAYATITDSQSGPQLASILDRWRAVERNLAAAVPGSPEAERLFEEFIQLRDEYMTEFRARHRRGRQTRT